MGIMDIFANDPNIFIGSDLLWYPVEGDPKTVIAPDVMVVFGRPAGDRGSYKQWEEEHIPPQVVFEILSDSNTVEEMRDKFDFYVEHGVLEYYEFDPDRKVLRGWSAKRTDLSRIWTIHDGWTSPRLGIHFKMTEGELIVTKPNGERFPSPAEINQQRRDALREAKEAREREQLATQRAEQAQAEVQRMADEIAKLRASLKPSD
jgi:Uma2 family endonuclease